MRISQHARKRMSQRRITGAMLKLVQKYGEVRHDKLVLDANQAYQLVLEIQKGISQLQDELRCAKKVADKGGLIAVEADNNVITIYNFPRKH